MALYRTGGGGMSETTLWTNSSPTANFSLSTITLSQGISSFDFIKIIFVGNKSAYSSGSEYRQELICPASGLVNAVSTASYCRPSIMGRASGTSNYFARALTYVSNTSLQIDDAVRVKGTGTSNDICIPLQIVGLKL